MINISYNIAIRRFVYQRSRTTISRRALLKEGKRNQLLLACLLGFKFASIVPMLCIYSIIIIKQWPIIPEKIEIWLKIPEMLYYSTNFYIYAIYAHRLIHRYLKGFNIFVRKLKKSPNSISPVMLRLDAINSKRRY
ncbi:unnamed protein product [Gordionus sp. m RMFG-2023]